jgi:hypothetical protein
VCYKLEEAIEIPCSDLLAIQHRKFIHSKMEIFKSPTGDGITTNGECVQPLSSVKLNIIDVLMINNGMDPCMISQNFGWFRNGWVVRYSNWS